MRKRVLQILLAVLLLALTVVPFFAYGLTEEESGTVSLYQEGNYDTNEGDYRSATLTDPYAEAENYVYTQLLAGSDDIFVGQYYDVPHEIVSQFYTNVINDHPDLFFVTSSYNSNYYTVKKTIAHIIPTYALTGNEIDVARSVFEAGVSDALSQVDDSMNDVQKALVLHDYLCDISTYPDIGDYIPETDSYTKDRDIYHSAYGVFYDGNVVCAGYSLAYSYLLNQVGVPCRYVSSSTMSHAWNRVMIDGEWYNVDVTWDDIDFQMRKLLHGSSAHQFFMRSDTYFMSDMGHAHVDGVAYQAEEATDTSYDTYFWDDVLSKICVINGDYYYIDMPADKRGILTKRTADGIETTIGNQFYTPSSNVSSPYSDFTNPIYVYDDETGELIRIDYETKKTYMVLLLAKLDYLDGRFYLAYDKKIYSMTFDGVQNKICEIENYPLGLGIIRNNLVYQIYSNPLNPEVYTLDKLEYYNNYLTQSKGSNYNNYPDINNDGVINAKDYLYITRG